VLALAFDLAGVPRTIELQKEETDGPVERVCL
jgi:hypothetical protein